MRFAFSVNAAVSQKRISLRPRLLEALRLIGSCGSLADIGCDHGRFSAAALQSGGVKKVIASDISEASLEKAKLLAERCRLSDRIEFRLADGFGGFLPGEVNKAAITGMGGELIASILEKNPDVVNSLEMTVMQPMRGEAELRKYLYTNEFTVLCESVVFDSGRYYQLLSARKGKPSPIPAFWPEDFWQFGPQVLLRRDENLLKLLLFYRSVLTEKLRTAEARGKSPEALKRERANTEKLIEFYELSGGGACESAAERKISPSSLRPQ